MNEGMTRAALRRATSTPAERALISGLEAARHAAQDTDPLQFELVDLWSELYVAMGDALHGRWSARCDSLVSRIARLTTLRGRPLEYDAAPVPLLLDGVYEAVNLGIGHPTPVPPEAIRQSRVLWNKYMEAK